MVVLGEQCHPIFILIQIDDIGVKMPNFLRGWWLSGPDWVLMHDSLPLEDFDCFAPPSAARPLLCCQESRLEND